MNKNLILIFSIVFSRILTGQTYAPSAGMAGSSAIHMDSSVFVSWASDCVVNRGYQDISNKSLGFASVGDGSMATGKAQSNAVLSLGDGGSAICTFPNFIRNGSGYDFAVFENSFDDVFLELAFIEVSSDGLNFFRFPAHSLTDTSTQTSSFGPTDATKINNLAGKYRGGYGTPFDLQELAGKAGLDIDKITHVKITDVVGSMDPAYASRDFYKVKVNDPWPTPFPSGGFDLDAVGVINQGTLTGLKNHEKSTSISIYPNPTAAGDLVQIVSDLPLQITVMDLTGKVLLVTDEKIISTQGLSAGVYALCLVSEHGVSFQKLVLR